VHNIHAPPAQAEHRAAHDVQEVEHIVGSIKALIAKGEKATAKAEQFFIAAGQHLKTLKANHAGSWAEWELLLKERVKISAGRASELMQIADGRKTVTQVRANDAEKHKRLRAGAKSSSGRPEENDDPPAHAEPTRKSKAESVPAPTEDDDDPDARPRHGWSNRLLQCQREVEKIGAEFANRPTLSDEGRENVAHFARHLADVARALADRIKPSGVAVPGGRAAVTEPIDDGIPEILRRTQSAAAS
jgi:hypothetical protein